MKTSDQSLQMLAHSLSLTLAPVLVGDGADVNELAILEDQISRRLRGEIFHSRTSVPLMDAVGLPTHSISYYIARTQKLIINLSGCYGRTAYPLLNSFRFGLFATIVYAHELAGLISENQRHALNGVYALILSQSQPRN